MKLVVLVDSGNGDFEKMAEIADQSKTTLIDTKNCNVLNEYRNLLSNIENFSHSRKQVMLARFSGDESIAQNLGDECSEMILTLSDRKTSTYYTGCPVNLFSDLIDIFKKGD